jgi:hypothetical protein
MVNPPLGTDLVAGGLTAFKAAHLVTFGDQDVRFDGATLGGTYGPADLAQCVHDRHHVPPQERCTCGFYGFRCREDAVELLTEDRVALLEVELWGAFHEFEIGYIAAAQNVRSVTLVPYCVRCLVRSERRHRAAEVLANRPSRDLARLIPVCDEHAEDATRVVTLLEVHLRLGVDVHFASDDDPLTAAIGEHTRSQRPLLPRHVRRLDDLQPGEKAHVFQNAIAQDEHGRLFINPVARLIQPLPGTDVPIRLSPQGELVELLLDTLTGFTGWQPRSQVGRFALPCRVVGQPSPAPVCTTPPASRDVCRRD